MLTQRVSWETKRVKCDQKLFFWANTESSPPPPYKQIPTTKSSPTKRRSQSLQKQNPEILNLRNKTEKITTKRQNKIKITFPYPSPKKKKKGLGSLSLLTTIQYVQSSSMLLWATMGMIISKQSPNLKTPPVALVSNFNNFDSIQDRP